VIQSVLSSLVFAFSISSVAFAASEQKTTSDSQSTLKIDDAAGKKNKVEGDIDQEILNARLRAESGSKSKFSMSVKGAYTGGSVESAFGQKRPLLSSDPGNQDFTSLDIGLNARYRSTKNDSFTLGTAFGFVTPFQGRVNKEKDAINVNDPNIGYNRVGKVFGLQTVGTVSYAYGTSIPSRRIDETHQGGLSYNVMKDFGNGLTAGASLATGYNFYASKAGENANARSTSYGNDRRTEFSLGLFPQAEYAITDKLAARTVFGYFNWRHLYGDQNRFRMLQTYVYQSIGVGWSITRDIYLYPNIQFVPDNIRSDFTNVALSTTINVF
jgi:hypothetical protein